MVRTLIYLSYTVHYSVKGQIINARYIFFLYKHLVFQLLSENK